MRENLSVSPRHAASTVGALILDHWQRPKEIAYKGAIDLVTSVDRESERIIVDTLQRAFPDHSMPRKKKPIKENRQRHIYGWLITGRNN